MENIFTMLLLALSILLFAKKQSFASILYWIMVINLLLAYPLRHILINLYGFDLRGVHQPFSPSTYYICYFIVAFSLLAPFLLKFKAESNSTFLKLGRAPNGEIAPIANGHKFAHRYNNRLLTYSMLIIVSLVLFSLSSKAGAPLLQIVLNPNKYRLDTLSSSGLEKSLLVLPYLYFSVKYVERLCRRQNMLGDIIFYVFLVSTLLFSALAYRAIATYTLVAVLLYYYIVLKRSVRSLSVSFALLLLAQALFALFRHLAATGGDESSSLLEGLMVHSIFSGWHGLDSYDYSLEDIKRLSGESFAIFRISAVLSLMKLINADAQLSFSEMFNNIISNVYLFAPRPGTGGVSEYLPSYLYVLGNKSVLFALAGSCLYVTLYWYLCNKSAHWIYSDSMSPSPLKAISSISILVAMVFLYNSPSTVFPSLLNLVLSWLVILTLISSSHSSIKLRI